MSINAIQGTTNSKSANRYSPVKITGYGALATGVASAIAGNKKKIKLHKQLAYITGILTLAHLAIVEWRHAQKKKTNTDKT